MNDIRILAIDPGLHKCGVSIINLDVHGTPTILYADTIFTKVGLKKQNHLIELHGERQVRLMFLAEKIRMLLSTYTPDITASEIPFWNPKRPGAFQSLVEVVTTVSNTIFSYDCTIPFERVSAAVIKERLGVSGSSGDKALVKEAIQKLGIVYKDNSIEPLGPDAIDSIAVGLCVCRMLNEIS